MTQPHTKVDPFEAGLSEDEKLLYRVYKYIADGTLGINSVHAGNKIRPLIDKIEERLGL
jgi:hypothetical protein